MFYFKFVFFLILMTFFFNRMDCMSNKEADTSINCSIQRKCSTNEDIAWATDGSQCYLFRNPCIFANEMCLRREKQLDEYKVVTQDECKKYCQESCTDEYAPVCGEYANAYKIFSNECNFYGHSCQNNQSYIFLHSGECNETVAA